MTRGHGGTGKSFRVAGGSLGWRVAEELAWRREGASVRGRGVRLARPRMTEPVIPTKLQRTARGAVPTWGVPGVVGAREMRSVGV